jgi:hypothetical protein
LLLPKADGLRSNPQTLPARIARDFALELGVLLAELTMQVLLFHQNQEMQADRQQHSKREVLSMKQGGLTNSSIARAQTEIGGLLRYSLTRL